MPYVSVLLVNLQSIFFVTLVLIVTLESKNCDFILQVRFRELRDLFKMDRLLS